jgi:hypothetical protein
MKNTLTRRLILMFFVTTGFLGSVAPSVALAARQSSKSQLDVEAVDGSGASAEKVENPLGAGIMLGDLNGISVKYFENTRNAFAGNGFVPGWLASFKPKPAFVFTCN